MKTTGFFEQVYEKVKLIPRGSVKTYGQIAAEVGTRDARRVGQALHANKSKDVPCHRVVFADGSLAPGYAFGGAAEQKKRLMAEGVKFEKEKVVE
jgi:methylated-DNA-protein-cysteine methyltransferase related protein